MSDFDWKVDIARVLADASLKEIDGEENFKAHIEDRLTDVIYRRVPELIRQHPKGLAIVLGEITNMDLTTNLPGVDYMTYCQKVMTRDLVLCRDCECTGSARLLDGTCYCSRWRRIVEGADFCSWGVRKEDGNENHD